MESKYFREIGGGEGRKRGREAAQIEAIDYPTWRRGK